MSKKSLVQRRIKTLNKGGQKAERLWDKLIALPIHEQINYMYPHVMKPYPDLDTIKEIPECPASSR
jgi:hypothetical protein